MNFYFFSTMRITMTPDLKSSHHYGRPDSKFYNPESGKTSRDNPGPVTRNRDGTSSKHKLLGVNDLFQ